MAGPSHDSVVFDRVAHEYDATRGLPPGVAEQVAADLVAAGGLAPDARVLEAGIGTGRIALPLSARVGCVLGVDLSRPMLARLQAKAAGARVAAARADATCLPFPDAAFDAAVAVHVFHLIPRWREVLGELARVLRPGAPLLHAQNGAPSGRILRLLMDPSRDHPGIGLHEREGFLEDAGWQRREERHFRYPVEVVPREMIARLERRSWSRLWTLTDDELARLVRAAREGAEQSQLDLDAPLRVEAESRVECWLPPADGGSAS